MTTIDTSTGPHVDPRDFARAALAIDAAKLEHDLRRVVHGEVRFDAGTRAMYATDSSNYRQVPIGVVIPRDAEDVVRAVEVCRRFGAPILSRGCGTSLAGQCCNVAVILDFSKYMNQVLEIDAPNRRARVQPGAVLDDLRSKAERFHLTYGPDPSTHDHCTLGGMIGNNSCGVHSVMAGETSANVEELEILTYDGQRMRVGRVADDELQRAMRDGGRRGEIYRRLAALRDRYADQIRSGFPHIPRRVSGYNLPALLPESGFDVARALVGSESTCVIILEATVRLVYSPPRRVLLVLGYPTVYDAGDHVPEIMAAAPIGLEGLDEDLVEDMKKKGLHPRDVELLPPGGGWLLVEFGGETEEEASQRAESLMRRLRALPAPPTMALITDRTKQREIWIVRESGLGATARVPGEPDTWEGWEDSSVPPDKLGGYLRALRKLFEKYDYDCALYGHFGQGCVHTRIDFDLTTEPGIAKFRAFLHEAAHLVVSFGGSLSGEHGDGQSRAELLPIMFSPDLMAAFHEFKAIWDPEWKMNPGKVVDAYHVDENLRLGAGYVDKRPTTAFRYVEGSDNGSFGRAVLRCVGVGECRRMDGGVMCPSFMATREEAYSTRGRSRLLWEMLQGDVITEGWKSEAVKDSLDLCLACKGCKHDCPMYVDMATYKAEFLYHYYEGRRRPRSAYAFGLIPWTARLASRAPSMANFFTHTPGLAALARRAAGVAPQRQIPAFASEPFTHWFRRRRARPPAGPRIILWPDTFNNFFFPATARAATEVLEAAGFRVEIPRRTLCCGRPLYDFGMLDRARSTLREVLRALARDIDAGTPVVGLEPSCVAVFRDELVELFPDDPRAVKLSRQTFLLSEFVARQAPRFRVAPMSRQAVVHAHCHQKSLFGIADEKQVLDLLDVRYEMPEDGCCGMAGAFGFEDAHYDISMRIGERALLPAVRSAPRDALVIANGFSCREQIRQGAGRPTLHLAEVMRMALPDAAASSTP